MSTPGPQFQNVPVPASKSSSAAYLYGVGVKWPTNPQTGRISGIPRPSVLPKSLRKR